MPSTVPHRTVRSWIAPHLPHGLLLLGTVLTLLAWNLTSRGLEREQRERFDNLSGYIVELLEDRVKRSMEVTLSFVGLFHVSDTVSRQEFHDHARMIRLRERVPGMIAIQYSPLIAAQDRAVFEERVRRDTSMEPGGYPDFRIHPPGERPFYVPVLYNEPMADNQIAFGHDTAAGAGRRQVMDQAIEQDGPAFSPPIRLLQGETGVVIRAPIYRRGMPTDTVEQRRAAFAGQVSCVFRAADVLRHAMPRQLAGFRMRVIDGGLMETDPALARLYDSNPMARMAPEGRVMQRREAILVGGRAWILEITTATTAASLQWSALAVLFGGLGLTLATFWLSGSLNTRFALAAAEAQRLHHGAHHDSLTGLGNRRGLILRLEQVLDARRAGGGKAALLFLDLDRFKAINDRHGHAVGDDVLRVVATRLRACLRPEDMVARLGGDEFVVLLDGAQAADWPAVSQRVENAVRQPMVTQGHAVSVGASIGVALAPRDGDDAASLLRHADREMYSLKAARRRTA